MSFKSPWLLLGLLLLAPAVWVWWIAERRRMRYAVRYPNIDVLATVVSGRSWSRYVAPVLFLLGLAALCVAVARPEITRMQVEERAAVILVVDTSRSMQAKDVRPTRLAAEEQAIRTFLDRAPSGLRIGLVVFAGEAQVAVPPTRDKKLVEAAVDQIDSFLVFGGTAIGDALQTAVELGRRTVGGDILVDGPTAAGSPSSTRTLAQATTPQPKSPISILFMSDGSQTRGVLQPLEGADLAKRAGFPVYTIALGTPAGVIERGPFGGFGGTDPGDSSTVIPVPPDPQTLRAIAETTGGGFSEARSADALQKAYARLGTRLGRVEGKTELTFAVVGVAAVLVLLAGAVSAILGPRLP